MPPTPTTIASYIPGEPADAVAIVVLPLGSGTVRGADEPDAVPGGLRHRVTRIAQDSAGVRLMSRGAGTAAQGVHEDPLEGSREIHFADASLNGAHEHVVVDPGGAVHHQRGVDVAGQVRDAYDV